MMNTSRKTNLGAWSICVHMWRQFIVLVCTISPWLFYPAIVALLSLSFYAISSPKDLTGLAKIRSKYPSQNDSFWRTFENGVNEVLQFNRPSSIVVMYRPQSEKLSDSILQDLSGYMIRTLEATDKRPIIVEAQELNNPPFSEDYGEVLSKFGEELRTQHVMIVKNIDQVVGKVAQAFHFLCDEYSPYVEKAVIIFTLKVNEYPNKDHVFAERLLRKLWTDIEEDTFSPLVTRMLGMIVKVNDINDATQTSLFKLVNIKGALIFIGVFLLSLILFLFIRKYYIDIVELCHSCPDQRESIWENLSKVYLDDQFFLFSDDKYFSDALIDYLQKWLHLSNVITLNEEDFDNLKEFCKKNEKYLVGGCVVVINNIEKVQGKLCKLFRTNRDVKTILKTHTFPIIYIAADKNINDEHLVLNESFMKLLPKLKVFS